MKVYQIVPLIYINTSWVPVRWLWKKQSSYCSQADVQIILLNSYSLLKWVARIVFIRYLGSISGFTLTFFKILPVYFSFHGVVHILVGVLIITFLEDVLGNLLKPFEKWLWSQMWLCIRGKCSIHFYVCLCQCWAALFWRAEAGENSCVLFPLLSSNLLSGKTAWLVTFNRRPSHPLCFWLYYSFLV